MTPLSLTATLGKHTGEKIRLALVECAKRRDEVSRAKMAPPDRSNQSLRYSKSTSALNLRLADLCRVWSTLKLLHPAVAHRFPDGAALDTALVQCIQRTLDDESGATFANVCAALLAAVGDPTTRVVPLDDVTPPAAAAAAAAPAAVEAQPLVRFTQDGIAVIEMTDHRQFADYTSKMPLFYARFSEARQKSKAIVFDLRSLHDVERGARDYWLTADAAASVYTFKFMFVEAFRSFLTAELLLPTRRARVYRGAPPAIRGAGAAARFGHGLLAWDGDLIPPADAANANATSTTLASQSEFVFIVNRRTPRSLVDVGIAVQSAGVGKLVYEHDGVSERIGAPFSPTPTSPS
jgi:hypothetical protein